MGAVAEPNAGLSLLTDQPFSAKGPFIARFEAAGLHDFAGAARHLLTKHALPKACIAALSAGEPSP